MSSETQPDPKTPRTAKNRREANKSGELVVRPLILPTRDKNRAAWWF